MRRMSVMSVVTDAEIAAGFRRYLDSWVRGPLDELAEMYDEIVEADRTGFPWQPAMEVLAAVETRRLWRALDDEELQDLYDLASGAGLHRAAAAFTRACHDRPYVDDGRIPAEIRRLVLDRDGHSCQACGSTDDLTIDHKIIPWINGGTSKDPENLQVLCRSCNSSKGTRPA
jgi:hypothetical protein